VTRGNPCLGHVSLIHSPPRCHVSINDSTFQMPPFHQLSPAMSTYDTTMLAYGPATLASVRTIQSTHLFLPICRFEQNAISLSSDVCLNPNELCWVCDDEAYAPVRFEAIPSTLNFEQNLIPWITPLHWKAFGPPKDYFQCI